MDHFYYGGQFFICLLEIFLFCFWINGFAERRKMKPIWKYCAFLGTVILCYGTGFLLNGMPYEVIGGVLLFLLGVLLFQGDPRIVLFYTFLYYMTETALEILLAMLGGILIPDRSIMIASGQYNGLLFEILVKLLQFLILFFTIRYLHPIKEYFGNRRYLLFLLPPLCGCILLAGGYSLYGRLSIPVDGFGLSDTGGLPWPWIFLILGSIGTIAVNIVTVYMVEETARITEENKRLELQHVQDELERKYYTEIANTHLQYDIYLHDVRRMIRIIASMVEDKQWDNAALLTDYMVDSIQDIRKNALCFHEILNALLVDRRSYAESLGLAITIDVREPLIMGVINEIDLVALTGNLLDNAIHAEETASEKRGIICRILTAYDGRHIIIEVINSYDKIIKREKKAAGSIGNKHGIGLISIQETLRKYGGILSKLEDGGRYFAKVVIPSEGKPEGKSEHSEEHAYVLSS